MQAVKTTKILNPYDDSLIAEVSEFSEGDIRSAITRAEQALKPMADLPAYQRGAILNKTAQLIHDQADSIARLMAQESGKPLKYSRGEVARAVETFNFA